PAAKLSDLKIDEPKQVVLTDVRRDAWTLHPNDVIGRVWLILRDGNTVDAYTTICPHLGCSINFHDAPAKNGKRFICPCHNGTWDFNCKLIETPGRNNPAPRHMDQLKVDYDKTTVPGETIVMVEYQNFRQGEHEKIVKQ